MFPFMGIVLAIVAVSLIWTVWNTLGKATRIGLTCLIVVIILPLVWVIQKDGLIIYWAQVIEWEVRCLPNRLRRRY